MTRQENSLLPAGIYVQSQQVAQDIKLQEQPVMNFASDKEFIYHLTHKVNNIVHKDGRIYFKITPKGELFANSVSPYAEKYQDNLEEKIKPLVLGFHNKRYLTYSSCEGHGMSFRRYVGLAFADTESREYVAQQILSLKMPGVSVNYLDNVVNQEVSMEMRKDPVYLQKYSPESISVLKEKETITFNIQFHRNYDEYFFLEIVILEAIPFEWKKILQKPFYYSYLYYLKKYKWDSITNRLVSYIESDSFKKYLY